MIKIEKKEKYKRYFENYSHNIPVIHAHLEDQYDGCLMVDDEVKPEVLILFTDFDFHYVAGNSGSTGLVDKVDEMIFTYFKDRNKKEGILFGPDEKWSGILEDVFKRHKGIIDKRMIFELDKELYMKNRHVSNGVPAYEARLVFEKEDGAKKSYPVARVFDQGRSVSFCSAFMLGKGHGEINVGTDEAHRSKGFAKIAAKTLIDHLLENDIEPDWCTWPYREASRHLATSLGFKLKKEISAYIWVEGFAVSLSRNYDDII